MTALPPNLRTILERLRAADGPLTIAQASGSGQNRMPTLISRGWATSVGSGLYEITDKGLAALDS